MYDHLNLTNEGIGKLYMNLAECREAMNKSSVAQQKIEQIEHIRRQSFVDVLTL